MSALAVTLFLAASGTPASASSHADEITLFASTMAIAKTVKESCSDIEPDDSFLEALRWRLHVVESDQADFAQQAHASASVLQEARAEAPSRQAWCGAVFRLYGPDGKLMHGMLRRR